MRLVGGQSDAASADSLRFMGVCEQEVRDGGRT